MPKKLEFLVAVRNSGHYGLLVITQNNVKKNLVTMIYTNGPPAVAPQ